MTDARRITVGPIAAAYLEIQQGVVLVLATDYDALHAEAEALRAEIEEMDALLNRQADLLRQTAIALRGPEPGLTRYSHSDIPTRATTAVAELDALRAENAALRESSLDVRGLVEALEECAATIAWNCFGECRVIHAGPIMPAAMALDTARAALAAHRQAQRQVSE